MAHPLLAALCLCAAPALAQDFTTLKGHGGPIMDIALSPGGQVVTASFDNSVGLWDERDPTWLEGHDAAVSAVNFSQAPALLSGGDDFRVLLWHPDLVRPFEVTRHMGKVSDIAVSPDGLRIATASWDGRIHLSRLAEALRDGDMPPSVLATDRLDRHQAGVNAVAFAPSGQLFSASSDGTLRIWEGEAGDLSGRPIVNHGFGVNELIVTEDWIAYGAVDGGTRIVTHQGKEIADFTLDRRPILALAWHAGTGQLAVGDGQGYIMMVDTENWTITRDFRATREGPVWALAFSPDGATIWAGGLDDVAYGWPVEALDAFDPGIRGDRSFLLDARTMGNGERQFMRKCSICHSLEPGPSRKAGPTLYGLFGRAAGTVPGYRYSDTLEGSGIVWDETTVDALFDQGPDHYIPGSRMPMQVIAGPGDRAALIGFLKDAIAAPGVPADRKD